VEHCGHLQIVGVGVKEAHGNIVRRSTSFVVRCSSY
jgi:hypothetical protein